MMAIIEEPQSELPFPEDISDGKGRAMSIGVYPFSDFGDPRDIGYDDARIRSLVELARPRASEA